MAYQGGPGSSLDLALLQLLAAQQFHICVQLASSSDPPPSFLSFEGVEVTFPVLSLGSLALHPVQFSSVAQSCPTLCEPMNRSTLSITNSWSSLRLTSESVMPSSHLILGRPLLLPPSIFLSESALRIRWPQYWSFSFSIIPSKEIPGLISIRMD